MLIMVLSSSIAQYPLTKINIIFSINDRNKKERVSEVVTRLRCGNEKSSCKRNKRGPLYYLFNSYMYY